MFSTFFFPNVEVDISVKIQFQSQFFILLELLLTPIFFLPTFQCRFSHLTYLEVRTCHQYLNALLSKEDPHYQDVPMRERTLHAKLLRKRKRASTKKKKRKAARRKKRIQNNYVDLDDRQNRNRNEQSDYESQLLNYAQKKIAHKEQSEN